MELKVACDCGQNYKFDVEPVGGRMPFTVNCPVCQADGTAAANNLIAAQLPPAPAATPPPPPPIAPVAGGLRINRAEPAESTAMAVPLSPASTTSTAASTMGASRPVTRVSPPGVQDFNLVRGILGALAGAAVGCALMYGFWLGTHFRFPWSGVVVGITAGYGARWLARGTDSTLGGIAAAIAVASVTGTYILMYGEFVPILAISIGISGWVAYKTAS